MYAEFDLVIPSRLEDALESLAGDGGGSALPLAGGTNLIVDLRARRISAERLVSLARLDELRGIRVADGRMVMGGRTTMSDILYSRECAHHAPSLVEQARVFAGQMVRNTATVAGNVCYGSPAADVVPPLMVLDASASLASASTTREVPLTEFFVDYRKTVRQSDELLTEISFELPPKNSTNLFYKLARRRGDAITVVGVAVYLAVEAGRCTAARVALGAVAPVVLRAAEAEEMLAGQVLTPALIDAAARQAAEQINPIDDIRASAEYRRHCVGALTRRLLTQAWEHLT